MKSGRFAIIPARAIDDRRLNPAAVLVLATLGTYGDRDGWCFPSLTTVAKRLGVTKQAVSKQIQALVALGYLEVQARKREDGGQSSNAYRIVHDRDLDIAPRQPEFDGGQDDVDGRQPHIDAPSTSEVDPIRTSQSNDLNKNGLEADFGLFWKAYPRKVKRPLALKAYLAARRKVGAKTILDGLERYKRTKPEYADWAHPSSWLNAERWADEPDAPNSQGPPSSNPERDEWAIRLGDFRSRRFWSAMWGPEPGKAGCRVPKDLLEEMAA